MLRVLAVLIGLLFGGAAQAQQATLVTPGAPLPMTSLASFLNAALLSVGSCNRGPSAPANGTGSLPFAGECWANTTANPWIFSYYDGSQWVEFGSLDIVAHTWSSGSTTVSAVSNSDGSLTISPTTGAVVASLNTGNANTWTATQTFSGNLRASGQLIETGTVAPSSAAGNTVVLGTISAPTLSNNGQAFLYNTAVNGAVLEGAGSTYDAVLASKSGAIALGVSTGTQNVVLGGTVTAASLSTSGTIGGTICATSGGLLLYTSGANCFAVSASLVTVGSTTVSGGTSGCALYDAAGTLGCTGVARKQLTGATTFYVNPNTGGTANCNGSTGGAGNDTTGTGTLAAPYATRTKAISVLAAGYDLNGQTVTIQLCDGTYTDSFQYYGPLLFGQGAPSSLIFNGNATTPTNVLIQTGAGLGYNYGFFFGFSAQIQNQELDQTGNLPSGGQDELSVGQGSKAYVGVGMTFGCNGWEGNDIGSYYGSQVYVAADVTINVIACQQTPTATFSATASTIQLSSVTGVYAGMRIQATDIPEDAYINAAPVGLDVNISCIYTSPCQTSGALTNTATIISGGGQAFAFASEEGGGIIWPNNGQSDLGNIITLDNYPFFLNFAFAYTQAQIQAQAVSFINPVQASGGCFTIQSFSIVDTFLEGASYFPCLTQGGIMTWPTATATLTTGNNSFTVSSATGAQVGSAVNGLAMPTGTWTAGSSTISLSSATGVCVGAKVQGAGILNGAAAVISALSGTTATLLQCVAHSGSRCVSNYPTYLSETNAQLWITGCGVPNGSVITGISGTTITTNNAAQACSPNACSTQEVQFGRAGAGNVNITGGAIPSSIFK